MGVLFISFKLYAAMIRRKLIILVNFE